MTQRAWNKLNKKQNAFYTLRYGPEQVKTGWPGWGPHHCAQWGAAGRGALGAGMSPDETQIFHQGRECSTAPWLKLKWHALYYEWTQLPVWSTLIMLLFFPVSPHSLTAAGLQASHSLPPPTKLLSPIHHRCNWTLWKTATFRPFP